MRFSLPRAALLAASVAAVPAIASAQTVTNPAQVQSGSYAIEPGHTQVGFSLLHFGFTYVSEGIYETTAARPVLRAGGAGWYSELAEASMLDLRRPSSSDTALDEGAGLPILPSTP
ncbi:hypothetical protein [Gluconobacter kanchanaburiensis]|uniref:Uncharacterized protein n=1 Tax=Gluconobacter kanchanaburiensis NBRC 103587 TaxID=1307948 RepID=A0A511BC71_9PROT|nr:hypothetical protein [Gluconobacter kanchanaburiensis]GEK97431.1 hypothetical protein GKA01_26280 [Gluconobacter kanchanaburiensis NBRC 103587]